MLKYVRLMGILSENRDTLSGISNTGSVNLLKDWFTIDLHKLLDSNDPSIYRSGWLQKIIPSEVRKGQPFLLNYLLDGKLQNVLVTDDEVIARKWANISNLQSRKLEEYFRSNNTFPLVTMYLKGTDSKITIPRKPLWHNLVDNNVYIHSFGDVIVGMNELNKILSTGFYELSYTKNDGTFRTIHTTTSMELMNKYYGKYAAVNPVKRESGKFNRMTKIPPHDYLSRLGINIDVNFSISSLIKSYMQVPDLEVPSSTDVFRIVHVDTIHSIKKINESDLDKRQLNLNFSAIKNLADTYYSDVPAPDEIKHMLDGAIVPSDVIYSTLSEYINTIINYGTTSSVNNLLEYIDKNLSHIDLSSCKFEMVSNEEPEFNLGF